MKEYTIKLNDRQMKRLRKIAKEYLFDDLDMTVSLVINLGLKKLEGCR